MMFMISALLVASMQMGVAFTAGGMRSGRGSFPLRMADIVDTVSIFKKNHFYRMYLNSMI